MWYRVRLKDCGVRFKHDWHQVTVAATSKKDAVKQAVIKRYDFLTAKNHDMTVEPQNFYGYNGAAPGFHAIIYRNRCSPPALYFTTGQVEMFGEDMYWFSVDAKVKVKNE